MKAMKAEAVDLLKTLTEAHGAPGSEGAVRDIFRKRLGDGVYADRSGNAICEVRGRSDRPKVMVAAHMDEVGFAVQAVTKSGLLRFAPLGGWWAHAVLGQRVRILTAAGREIPGVVGAKPPHFLQPEEREKLLKLDQMFIDIGAAGADDVKTRFGVRPGDPIVPDSSFTPMHDADFLLSKAFDDRVGVAVVIQSVLEWKSRGSNHPNTVFGVGTVQEEVGTRGARTAAYTVNPDAAIVLEGTPADDLPEVPEDERQGALGRGVQIRVLDPSAIMNRPFLRFMTETAEANGIPCQLAVRTSGSTDARPIHLHRKGVPTVVLGVPARYIHTANSIIHLEDYVSAVRLVVEAVNRLDAETVEGFSRF